MVDCEKSSNFARMNLQMFRYITLSVVLTAALMLLSACSNSDDAPTTAAPAEAAPQEVLFNANVWRMMQGSPSRATTYDNQAALQSLAHFYCAAYNAGTLTSYIAPVQVSYAASQWTFDDGKHYWPAEGSLDFFAYAPYAGVSYITDLTYAATPNVTFNCVSLPMTNAEQSDILEEFIYDIQTGKNKSNSSSGVALTFQHPFAKIKLQLSASHPDITINSITFKNIKNNGSYSHTASPKWTTSGDATNLVLTFTGSDATFEGNASSAPLTQVGPDLIMIPQAWAGEIEVNASWNDWGDTPVAHVLTKTISAITWAPGTCYTYTFTITPEDLTVSTTNYTEQW